MSQGDRIRELLDQGLAAFGLGKPEDARRAWSEALRLDPQNARAQEYLRFLEDSQAIAEERGQGAYRPDEGSDAALKAKQAEEASRVERVQAEAPLSSDQPVITPKPLALSRPPVDAAVWGDLYDWSGSPPPPSAAPAAPPPSAAPAAPPPPSAAPATPMGLVSVPPPLPPPPAAASLAPPLPPPAASAVPALPPLPDTSPRAPAEDQPSPWSVLTPPPILKPKEDEGAFSRPPTLDDIPPLGPARPEPAASSPLGLVAGEVEPVGPAPDDVGALIRGARELLELDDFSGVLELAKKVMDIEPAHQEARFLHEQASTELVRMYSSKVGDLAQVPRVRMSEDEIIWLNLDHRAGFVLSLIDGHTSFDEILMICGLSQLDALRILAQLVVEKVIVSEPAKRGRG